VAKSVGVLQYRRGMVDWICEAGENYRLSRTTAHVACAYLDRVCAAEVIPTHRLALVSLAAIQVAAKFEEKEESVPSVRSLIERSGHEIKPGSVHQMEVMILTRLNWCATVVTPLHFLAMHARRGVVFAGERSEEDVIESAPPHYLSRYLDFFADLCCQEYRFSQYLPSALAAAIVLATRRALFVEPLWNPRLTEVLGYSLEEIKPVFTALWDYYREPFRETCDAVDAFYSARGDPLVASSTTAPKTRPIHHSGVGATLFAMVEPSTGDEELQRAAAASEAENDSALRGASSSSMAMVYEPAERSSSSRAHTDVSSLTIPKAVGPPHPPAAWQTFRPLQ
jgi:hypothetical protein